MSEPKKPAPKKPVLSPEEEELLMATGRIPVPVKYKKGEKSVFEVIELEIEPLYRFIHLYIDGNDFELVALCTGQPKGMLNKLSSDSFAELVEKSHAVNFRKAMPIISKSPSLASKVIPALLSQATSILSLKGKSEDSSNQSAEPALSESAVEIPSGSEASLPAGSAPSSNSTT